MGNQLGFEIVKVSSADPFPEYDIRMNVQYSHDFLTCFS